MVNARFLPLQNDVARLRRMRAEDASAYASGTADPAVREHAHLPEPEYTEASVTALIRGEVEAGLRRGDLAVLTIADPVTDAFTGSLVLFDPSDRSVEVGFWVHPNQRGGGRSGAALALAAELARRSGYRELRARAAPENRVSGRVLEQSGFTRGAQTLDRAPSGRETALLHYSRRVGSTSPLPLRTDRLRLRLHEPGDAAALQRVYGREEVARYLLEEPWSGADAERRLAERMAKTGLDDGGTALALVVEHRGEVVGDVQLWLTDPGRRIGEIGWVLDPDCGGRGLATEAVRAVLDLAFGRFGLHRIAAQMDARNEASARLAERSGMRREAHLRQDWWSKGEWTDTLVFGLLSADRSSPTGGSAA